VSRKDINSRNSSNFFTEDKSIGRCRSNSKDPRKSKSKSKKKKRSSSSKSKEKNEQFIENFFEKEYKDM
jgi:hypothetical protein